MILFSRLCIIFASQTNGNIDNQNKFLNRSLSELLQHCYSCFLKIMACFDESLIITFFPFQYRGHILCWWYQNLDRMDEDEDVYVNQLRDVFDVCDTERTGKLNREQLEELCEKLQLATQSDALITYLLGSDDGEGQVGIFA